LCINRRFVSFGTRTWPAALWLAALALPGSAAFAASTPTFNRDIAPIIYHNCSGCHRPGQVAPFSLLTYEDTAKRAAVISAVTSKRFMPPWKAEPGYGHFEDERRLTDQQIAMIADWASHGAPEGNPKDKPKPPEFSSGWLAGKPDAVFSMPEPFSVPADGRDRFQCFVIPLNAGTERYVKTVEFHPGNPRIVHHVLFYLDTSGEARRLDAATPEPGYPCFGGPRVAISAGLGGWAPGATPEPWPAGIAQIIEKGADLVMQVHYHPSGKPETDQSSIGLTYTTQPQKALVGMLLGNSNIDIPPGKRDYTVKGSLLLPQDVELIGITPHAHWLGKSVDVEAHLPGGKTTPLIRIDDWDFNWQTQYRYTDPVKLPKGTRIEMTFSYDNSAENPRNPSNPPHRVRYGEQTTDEMAFVFLQALLPSTQDVQPFRRAMIISRITQILDEGGDFSELGRRQAGFARAAIAMFDTNHDGKLDDKERQALIDFLSARIR